MQTYQAPFQFLHTHPRIQQVPGQKPINLPDPTKEAKNLMTCLIRQKEDRLSTKEYLENDFCANRPRGRFSPSYQTASFVFEDDARDIKQHPFFRGVKWSELHLRQPPFVPRIRGDQPVTKYFEDEKEILASMPAMEPKVRARDKILRDPHVAYVAMEVRKKYAFIGYEYRRNGC
jgi:protein-serine/threonine kinase